MLSKMKQYDHNEDNLMEKTNGISNNKKRGRPRKSKTDSKK
jgi:hypothetical protein